MADFAEIPILDVASRCGIKAVDSGMAEVAVNCPFCDDKKRHLCLNTVKQVYYCHRCGEFGNAVTMFAKLSGTDNKTAYRELVTGNIIRSSAIHKAIHKQDLDSIERVPVSLAERHVVYTELLQNLDLSARHKNNLLKRGLDSFAIESNLYRTAPDSTAANRIAGELSGRFLLEGVPGFYTNNKAWRMALYEGFFIPVRSTDGRIQGLQIRLDDVKKRKYRWFSSNHKENGTQAYSWIHIVNSGGDTVFITEGTLKADVASFLTGDCFIGSSGVNCINGLAPILNSMGVNKVYEALDMDKYSSKNVAAAANNLRRKLAEAGIECISCAWDPNYNGIDDYLLSCI